ncbi:MAG: hypothetical protein H7226_02415 [Salinibacterium sp.]|nr:hypothetical protein [Salinibacterium sp.]
MRSMMIDRLGTLSLRSSRIMVVVILAVAVGFVLVQLKLVVIPLLIVFAVQDQWGTLARSATTGIDTIQEFLENGPIPIDQAQLDSVRDTVVAFLTSAQFGSGAVAGVTVAGALAALIALVASEPFTAWNTPAAVAESSSKVNAKRRR